MKYKRIVISHYGDPEVLQVVEDELQEPRPGEVRVKILAAGVAWGDILKRSGLGTGVRPPFTPGYDIVGKVERLGDDVSSVKVGQMVAALTVFGGYAEYICLPASELVQVPSDLDPAQAVCLVMNYVVAYQMLYRAASVKPGERVLIHSAAGGVGTALLQLGQLAKLEIYGTASSGKHELIASLGGAPIDYKKEDFVERVFAMTGDGVDVIFDPIGGTHTWQSYRMLRKGGRLIVYGAHTVIEDGVFKMLLGSILSSLLNLIPGKRILNYNVTRSKYSTPEWCREDLSKLFVLLAQKKVKPIIAEQMPLVEAAHAHELLEKGSATGKIVLICNT
ncbi:MAG: medium chain dehydrogenase/reductase family protein [Chloroflexi bacterium]|nr:medium chain dehydrogenase/reductase family protein [Chloroflexota bacterium]MCL5611310.1 medium chain dehydrogenase/reductase family protein [Chloroflexota bacterium]